MSNNENKKTHWKSYHNPNFIGAYAFQPNEHKILTIKCASQESVKSERGTEECLVVYFKSSDKPLICNVTNAKSISKVANSPYVEDWANIAIELYVSKVKAFGEIIDAVRVKPVAPKVKKDVLNPKSERWDGAIKSVCDKKITIEKIKNLFEISESDIELLKQEVLREAS